MSIFQCRVCGGRENTASCNYWENDMDPICSMCDPQIGKWHGEFPQKFYPIGTMKTGDGGNLTHIATGSQDIEKYEIPASVREATKSLIAAAVKSLRQSEATGKVVGFEVPYPTHLDILNKNLHGWHEEEGEKSNWHKCEWLDNANFLRVTTDRGGCILVSHSQFSSKASLDA